MKDDYCSGLNIFTLGCFKVIKDGILISEHNQHSYMLWKLFKFLLVNKGKLVHSEVVMDTLWPEKTTKNCRHLISNLIYRLRRVLNQNDSSAAENAYIRTSQGCYCFEPKSKYWLDIEEFELIKNLALKLDVANTETITEYHQKLALYRGSFLSELPYEDWAINMRKNLQQTYVKFTLNLNLFLRENKLYQQQEQILKEALQNEIFEEEFHVEFIKNQLQLNKKCKAKIHFDYFIEIFNRELGIKPYQSLEELIEQCAQETQLSVKRLEVFQTNHFKRQDLTGAFFCQANFFNDLLILEEKRAQRYDMPIHLISLRLKALDQDTSKYLTSTMDELEKSLRSGLRQGDVVCKWNENQYLILLGGGGLSDIDNILNRFESNMKEQNTNIFFDKIIRSLNK